MDRCLGLFLLADMQIPLPVASIVLWLAQYAYQAHACLATITQKFINDKHKKLQ